MCDDTQSPAEPKEKKRRGYASLDAIDPRDGKTWHVLLPDGKMDTTAKRGRGAAMELADTVRWALVNPGAIFCGVRDIERDLSEDKWLCYVSTPKHAYNYRSGKKCDRWTGEVFLVFVTDERVVYNWYWYKADENKPFLPDDYQNRFLKQVL